ncbi:hypothetical protein E8E14_007206 [Neopestalotiopsis sp. 37M]|nr:hypothetical protein E8E14_007206 [Neopestalotiopsis sp. 37M]
MPYYATADEWLRQSQLLLEARPTTTRVTTRYSIRAADAPRKSKDGEKAAADSSKKTTTTTEGGEAKPPRGRLVLKTFDPKTGTTLKYKTSKAAEVSRLITSLGKLGRPMAGLPALKDDVGVPALGAPESGTGTPAPEKADPVQQAQQGQQPGGGAGGGKGKKKKGKR